jgi:hypothetical protein
VIRYSMMALVLALAAAPSAGCFFTSDDTATDTDSDGVDDDLDNCPTIANNNQADADGDGIGDVCDTIAPTEGAINFTWSITAGGAPSTCAAQNIATASFLITRDSDSEGFDEMFTCADMQGLSGPVGIDQTFIVSPCALDAGGACLSDQTVTFNTDTVGCDTIDANLCIANAPMVIFDI